MTWLQLLDFWRAVGALIGAMLAFVVAWPTSRKDFIRRLVVSLVFGFLFSIVVRHYFEWPATPRYVVPAAILASFFSWAFLGAGIRILQSAENWPFWKR